MSDVPLVKQARGKARDAYKVWVKYDVLLNKFSSTRSNRYYKLISISNDLEADLQSLHGNLTGMISASRDYRTAPPNSKLFSEYKIYALRNLDNGKLAKKLTKFAQEVNTFAKAHGKGI